MKVVGKFLLCVKEDCPNSESYTTAIPVADIWKVNNLRLGSDRKAKRDEDVIQICHRDATGQNKFVDVWGTIEEFARLAASAGEKPRQSSIAEDANDTGFELAHLRDARDGYVDARDVAEERDWFSQAAVDARAAHLASADQVDTWTENHVKHRMRAQESGTQVAKRQARPAIGSSTYLKPDTMDERR